jgi:uncharacterized membrane protein
MPAWLKLLGVALGGVGLAMGFRPTVVVVVAAMVTGLLAGLPPADLLSILGKAFVDNRLITLFIITLPAIAAAERFGLQREAAKLIHRIRGATAGRLLICYQLARIAMGLLGLRLNGHPSFVRPLIAPMALGAADREMEPENDDPASDRIKAACAAAENYGNFYGQNLSPVQPGVLLVFGILKGLGLQPELLRLVWYTVPIVVLTVIAAAVQFLWLDRRLAGRPVVQSHEEPGDAC